MIYKIAITGPSSSGKSRVIDEFEKDGYPTIKEAAEDVIRKMPSNDTLSLRQRIMADLQYYREMEMEQRNRSIDDKVIIMDRGLHDYIGFSRFLFGDYSPFPKNDLKERYFMVFALESNGFTKNNVRIEKNKDEAETIFEFVLLEYMRSGHKITTVPNLSSDVDDNSRLRKRYIEKRIAQKIAYKNN